MLKLKIVATCANFIANTRHYYYVLITKYKSSHKFVSNSDKKVKNGSKVSFLIIDKKYISFLLFIQCQNCRFRRNVIFFMQIQGIITEFLLRMTNECITL